MVDRTGYQKYFYMLAAEDRGYSTGTGCSGYIKIEVRDGKGKLNAFVQNIKDPAGAFAYAVYIIRATEASFYPVKAGIIRMQKNKGDLVWEFDPANVGSSGVPIQDFNIFVVRVETQGDHIITPLAAYKDKKVEWREKLRELMIREKEKINGQKRDTYRDTGTAAGEQARFEITAPIQDYGEIKQITEIVEEGLEKKQAWGDKKKEEIIENDIGEEKRQEDDQKENIDEEIWEENQKENIEEFPEEKREDEDIQAKGISEADKLMYQGFQESILEGIPESIRDDLPVNKPENEQIEDEKAPVPVERENEQFSLDQFIKEFNEKEETAKAGSEQSESPRNFHTRIDVPGSMDTSNPCMNCPVMNGVQAKPDDRKLNMLDKVKEALDRHFEEFQPFERPRANYRWWKVNNPVYLNNILYMNKIKSPIFFNPMVIMSHFKNKYLIMGTYFNRQKRREYIVCGIPGVYGIDERPFGDLCKWMPRAGDRPRYGGAGYWLVYIDPATGKLVTV